MQYKFKQNVGKEDYLEFYKYHVAKNFYSPIKIVFVAIFFIILFSGPLFGKPELLYGGLVLLFFVIMLFFRVSRSGGKIYDGDPDSFNYKYTFDDVTVTFATKEGQSSKMWSEFVKKYETEKYIYIFTKSNKGLMFIKDSMEAEVLTFLLKKLEDNVKEITLPKLFKKKAK